MVKRARKFEDIARDFPSYFPRDNIRCQKCAQVIGEYKSDRFRSFMVPHMMDCFKGEGVMRDRFKWE